MEKIDNCRMPTLSKSINKEQLYNQRETFLKNILNKPSNQLVKLQDLHINLSCNHLKAYNNNYKHFLVLISCHFHFVFTRNTEKFKV